MEDKNLILTPQEQAEYAIRRKRRSWMLAFVYCFIAAVFFIMALVKL
ncbi:hypothetical protein [Entomobacter blattae]|nr:hypothetical protein [Entomobacter blattae]